MTSPTALQHQPRVFLMLEKVLSGFLSKIHYSQGAEKTAVPLVQSICPGGFHVVGSGCSVHGNSWAWGERGRWQSRILSSSWSAGVLTKCNSVCSSDSGLQSLVSHFLLESQNCCYWCFYLLFDFVFRHHCRCCV